MQYSIHDLINEQKVRYSDGWYSNSLAHVSEGHLNDELPKFCNSDDFALYMFAIEVPVTIVVWYSNNRFGEVTIIRPPFQYLG